MIERGDAVRLDDGVIHRSRGRGQRCDQYQARAEHDDEHAVRREPPVQTPGELSQCLPAGTGPCGQIPAADIPLIRSLAEQRIDVGVIR
jgi:hypothetical protein